VKSTNVIFLSSVSGNSAPYSMDTAINSPLATSTKTSTTLSKIAKLAASIKSAHNWTDLSYDAIERRITEAKAIFRSEDINSFTTILVEYVQEYKASSSTAELLSTIMAANEDMVRVLQRLKKRYTTAKKKDSSYAALVAVLTQHQSKLNGLAAANSEMLQLSFRVQAFMTALHPLDYEKMKSDINTLNTTITFDVKQNVFRIAQPDTPLDILEPNSRLGTSFQELTAIKVTLTNIEKTISSQANEFQSLQNLIVSKQQQLAALTASNQAILEYFTYSSNAISSAFSQVISTVQLQSPPVSPQSRKRKLPAENKVNHLKLSTNEVDLPRLPLVSGAAASTFESDRKRLKVDLDENSIFENVVRKIAVPESMILPTTVPPATELVMPLSQKLQDLSLVPEPLPLPIFIPKPDAQLTTNVLERYPTGVKLFYNGRYIVINKVLINHRVDVADLMTIMEFVNYILFKVTPQQQQQQQQQSQEEVVETILTY